MKKNFFIKLISIIFCMLLFTLPVYATDKYNIDSYVNDILTIKKESNNSLSNGYLINTNMMSEIFNSDDAKFIISMSQYGIEDNIDLYGKTLLTYLKDKYSSSQKLNDLQPALSSQIALTLLACNYNPLYIEDKNKNVYNFLADTIYNRDSAFSLGKDGTEGYVWGLIALDAYNYNITDDIWEIKDGLISGIIENQEDDGTFITISNTSPYYLTALVLTAVSPYYHNEERKQAERQKRIDERIKKDQQRLEEGKKATFEEFEKQYELEQEETLYDKLDVTIEKCIDALSNAQDENGAYSVAGSENVKVTSAVITALCTMGIDIEKEKRFIKNDNNLMDGLLKLRKNDGSFSSDKNANVISDTTDAFSALVSYSRFKEGKTSLYNFSKKEFYKKSSMLGISDADVSNILNIGRNLNLDDYPYLYMMRNKLEGQNTPKADYLISYVDYLLSRLSDQQDRINYINSVGNEIIFSVQGVNLSKKKAFYSLIDLCDSIPTNNKKRIIVYDDLLNVAKQLDSSVTIDIVILALCIILIFCFILIILLTFIKKSALKSLMTNSINSFNNHSIKTASRSKSINVKLPFEDNEEFFDYDTQPQQFQEEQEDKILPFERDDDFFDYNQHEEIVVEDAQNFCLPFENEENFFVYNDDNSQNDEKY